MFVSTLEVGIRVFHKTWATYNPAENCSLCYSLAPPIFTITDRGQLVHEYELTRVCNIIVDNSLPPEDPLKYKLHNLLLEEATSPMVMDFMRLLELLTQEGLDGIVTRIDPTSNFVELLCTPPSAFGTLLRYVRTYELAM